MACGPQVWPSQVSAPSAALARQLSLTFDPHPRQRVFYPFWGAPPRTVSPAGQEPISGLLYLTSTGPSSHLTVVSPALLPHRVYRVVTLLPWTPSQEGVVPWLYPLK